MAEKSEKKGKKSASTSRRSRRRGGDEAAVRRRIVEAGMELAVDRRFEDITLADIAAAAGLSLAELRRHIARPTDVLRLLADEVDAAVLASLEDEPLEGEATDRLFELVMRRLERLAPWRPAIRNILRDAPLIVGEHPPLACRYLLSQKWMLAAAGLERPGLEGAACAAALGAIHARALATWVEDDDPGFARTMARLDKDLKRAGDLRERLAGPADAARAACRAGFSLARGVARMLRPGGWKSEETETPPPPAAESATGPEEAPRPAG